QEFRLHGFHYATATFPSGNTCQDLADGKVKTMPHLQNEKSRVQAEIKAAESETANLTTQIQTQQQAVAAAKAKVDAAPSKLANLQGQRPALAAAAVSADQTVAGLDQQIAQHEQNEPDKFIERP